MNKQIISVSRRTDISAFFSDWFMAQVKQGYCDVANPYNPNQISHVFLKAEDVLCFVFWTRNPQPLMKYLVELDQKGYHYYFLLTLTAYSKDFEPFRLDVDQAIKNFQCLSKMVGKEKVIWRYDPLILSEQTSHQWHVEQFEKLSDALQQLTEKVIFSIVEPYEKTKRRLVKKKITFKEDKAEYRILLEDLAKIAKRKNIVPQYCCPTEDYSDIGIVPAKCIDQDLVGQIVGEPIRYMKDKGQRKTCLCQVSKDIGMNNTCLFGCEYCYATISHQVAVTRSQKYKSINSLIGS